jgi:2-keto-4-pentenoate hydratase/2-oxohepta-3-ene-1,7-dioic acid hydratase in catechol pathway
VRLFAFLADDGPTAGLLTADDRVVRLKAADGGLDLALAEGRLAEVLDEAASAGSGTGGHVGRRRSDLEPLPALEYPGKIVCVGLNYRDHIAEQHLELPARPMLFAKFGNAIIGDGEPIVRPEGTTALDLEVELGVVIGRRARRVAAANAMDHVAGYLVVNDVTARDWQGNRAALREGERGDGQWLRAKGSDTFFPIGPILATPDSIPNPHRLALRSWVTRAGAPSATAGTATAAVEAQAIPMQDGTTADMVWQIPELIAYISRAITLESGDILSTGTPAGVGVHRVQPLFLEPGDRVRCEVEGIGTVENPVVDWTTVGEDD